MVVSIRRAAEADLPALTEIYNDAVVSSTATLDLVPQTAEQRKDWLLAHNKGSHPLLVAEFFAGEPENGAEPGDGMRPAALTIAGYASLSPLFPMAAYAASAELSIYIDRKYRKRGIGRQLMSAGLETARKDPQLHMVVSKITAGNAASVRLHEVYGFQKTGVLREIAWKCGQRLDVEIYQLAV